MTFAKTPYRLAEELVIRGMMENFLSNSHSIIQHYIQNKKPLPDHLLPGRSIQKLDSETRKNIQQLKPIHFQHRIF